MTKGNPRTIGHSLPDYTFHRILGKGRYGKVYLVQEKNSQEFYACKVVNYTNYRLPPETINEIMVYKAVNMGPSSRVPYIPKLHKTYIYQEAAFVIIDLLEDTFRDYINNTPREELVANFDSHCQQAVTALAGMHHLGFTHGDLSLDNLLIKDNQLYLTDFGLSMANGCYLRGVSQPYNCDVTLEGHFFPSTFIKSLKNNSAIYDREVDNYALASFLLSSIIDEKYLKPSILKSYRFDVERLLRDYLGDLASLISPATFSGLQMMLQEKGEPLIHNPLYRGPKPKKLIPYNAKHYILTADEIENIVRQNYFQNWDFSADMMSLIYEVGSRFPRAKRTPDFWDNLSVLAYHFMDSSVPKKYGDRYLQMVELLLDIDFMVVTCEQQEIRQEILVRSYEEVVPYLSSKQR